MIDHMNWVVVNLDNSSAVFRSKETDDFQLPKEGWYYVSDQSVLNISLNIVGNENNYF